MANIFLSHSSHDQAAAESLHEWLKSKGFHALFLDCHPDDGISAGRLWERELYRNLKASDAVIVICSEASMKSRWCFVEICLARDQGKTIFPARLDDCTVDRLLDERQVVDFRSDRLQAYERLLSRLLAEGYYADDSIRWEPDRPPYPGLKVFEEADAGVFFGRTEEIRSLRARLNQLRTRGADRMLMVSGASGSGKSSLVRAGIVPLIAREHEAWRVIKPFRPGKGAIGSLAQGLASALVMARIPGHSTDEWLELRDQLQPADDRAVNVLVTLAERLTPVDRPGEAAVLLVVDQWEELLGPHETQTESTAFHTLLRRAIEAPRSPLIVLATLRSDFSDAARNHIAWRGFKWKSFDLGPMAPERFPQLVDGPARRAGLTFESGLVARLSHDAGVAGALPLLAFTLRELFERCKDKGNVTLEDYKHHDGIRGAVSSSVNEAIGASLSDDDEAALRRAFLSHLVWIDDRGHFLRRQAYWNDLSETARPLLEEFVRARLLTSDVVKDEESHEERHTVEVVHETLFEAWNRLKGWLDESRELLLWRKGIEGVRHSWQKAAVDQKPGFLLTGARVAEARRWLASNSEDLQAAERGFLEASVVADDERQSRERAATEEKIRLMQERLRLVRNRAVFAIAAGALAVGLAILGVLIWLETTSHRSTKLARTRLLQDASLDRERMGDPGPGSVLLGHALVEAAGQDKGLEDSLRVAITLARGRLLPLRNILEVTGDARGCAVAPGARLAIVGTSNGVVWYVDLARSQLTTTPASAGKVFYKTGDDARSDSVPAVAFDPLGTRFAAATIGGTIHIVDTAAGGTVRKFVHPGQPMSVDFSPDGRSVLVAGFRDEKNHPNPTVMAIYDAEYGACARPFNLGYELYAAAFSPDGRWVAAGGGIPPNPRLAAWDLKNPEAPPRILPQSARVFSLTFRPGRSATVVAGDVNGHVQFWDLEKSVGMEAGSPEFRHDKQVRVVSFSDDGRLLLVGGEDGTAQVWDVESHLPIGQRLMHRGQVRGGAINLKAGRVVTASFAGDIHVWDLRPATPAGQIFPHRSPVWDATFDDTGERVLTGCPADGDTPGSGWVWNVAGGPPVRLNHGADVMVARFRPNSAGEAVTCGNDGSVYFWNTMTGQRIGAALSHRERTVYTAAFDGTGDRFVFAGRGKDVRFCEFNTNAKAFRETRQLEHPALSFVWTLRFGPIDGQLFSDGGLALRVWAMRGGVAPTFRDLRPPQENQSNDEKVDIRLGGFDRTGHRALTLASDGGIAVWDLVTPQAPPIFLGHKPHGPGQPFADWHSARDVIATGGPDGVVRLWTPDGKPWSLRDLRHPSSIEVLAFSPDGRWLATGCRDGGLRLWSVDSGVWTGAGWYHKGPVTRVQFSQDGRRLLSASRDGTARVVQIPEPTQGESPAILAELEADAGILVAVKGTGTASSVTAPQPLTAETFRMRRRLSQPASMRAPPSLSP